MYPNAIVKVLSKVQFLDHYPLLISCQTNLGNVVPRPFRVKCAWLTHSNYKEVFYSNWDKDISFLYNTRRLTNSLTSERRDVFGSIKLKKKRLLSRIGGIKSHNENARMLSLLSIIFLIKWDFINKQGEDTIDKV